MGSTLGRGRSAGSTIATVAVALTAGISAGWCLSRPTPAPIGVVVITLDTTRADRLSVYGFMDAEMPHLERLAREGVVFDQATSVAPLTLPAHSSLLTGLFPPGHGVRDNGDGPLSPAHVTLAESLSGRGFRTGAFVGSVVLAADRGLQQGFDHYGGVSGWDLTGRTPGPRRQRPADEVVSEAISWIETIEDSPFFAWVHLYDPHRPYEPPEPFRSRHADPYVAELAFVDSQIGRLLETLDRRQLLERTIVVVAADHGESLGDHGERDHGIFLYDSVLRVPLIIRVPGVSSRRVADVVRLVDIMPTVLDLLRAGVPPMDGSSLVTQLRGQPGAVELDAYAESQYTLRFGWSPLRALRAGRYKLIEAPRPELYDLERDPFEEHNIHEDRPEVARVLSRRLSAFGSEASPRHGEHIDPVAAGELRQRLASLGYVGTGPAQAVASRGDRPDPKDCIGGLAGASLSRLCEQVGAGAWPVPISQLFPQGPSRPERRNEGGRSAVDRQHP